MNKYDEFLEENFEMASRNEQEAAETTIEKKNKMSFQNNTTKCIICRKQPQKLK